MTDETATTENTTILVEAACDATCCQDGPKWTPEEVADRKKFCEECKEKAAELLEAAHIAALRGQSKRAGVFVEIANVWDSMGY